MPINWGLLNPNTPTDAANSYYQGQQEMQKNALLAAQLQQAGTQNEMAKYQLSQAQRNDTIQNRLLQELQDAGTDPLKIQSAYIRAGKGKEAFEMQKAQADVAKTQAETAKAKLDYFHSVARDGSMNPSDENLAALAKRGVDMGIWDFNEANRQLKGLLAKPITERQLALASLGATAENLLKRYTPEMTLVDLGGYKQFVDKNIVTNPTVGKAQMTMTMAPGEKERLGLEKQRVGLEGARLNIARQQAEQGKTPPGYRQLPDGSLQAIPGGPADTKIQGQFNQDTAALQSSISSMDRLATAANEAMNHPGLAGTAGVRGALPNIPGSQSADAAALLNTLKSQVAFGVLQDMRNNSKTGGALGSVSDAEGKRLEANLAALEKSQSVDQLKSNLKKIIDYSNQAKDRITQSYNMRYKTAQGTGANLQQPPAAAITHPDFPGFSIAK